MFDVVTTSIYPFYARYPGGPELEGRTLALKFFAGRRQPCLPGYRELLHFGKRLCRRTPRRGARGGRQGLTGNPPGLRGDARMPPGLLTQLRERGKRLGPCALRHRSPSPEIPTLRRQPLTGVQIPEPRASRVPHRRRRVAERLRQRAGGRRGWCCGAPRRTLGQTMTWTLPVSSSG